jgi:hypothetical protein
MNSLKKYLFGLLFFSVLVSCDTESNVDPIDSQYFVKYYGSSGDQSGNKLKQLEDGFIMIGTSSPRDVNNSEILVVKTDLNGNEQWKNTYGRDFNDTGVDIEEVATGFVIAGNSINELDSTDILVINISDLGEEQSRAVIGGVSHNDEVSDILITQEGNIMIAGATSNTSEDEGWFGGNYDFYFPQLRADLSIVSNWVGHAGFEQTDRLVKTFQKPNGDFVFYGISDKDVDDGSVLSQNNITILQYSNQGEPNTDDRTFGTLGNEAASDLFSTSDKGLLLVGSTTTVQGTTNVSITRLREDYSVIGEYSVSATNDLRGVSILESQGGGFVVTGNIDTATGTNIYVARTTNSGAILWERKFGSAGDNTAGDILQLEDESYVFTGTIDLDNQTKMCLIKINENGDLTTL